MTYRHVPYAKIVREGLGVTQVVLADLLGVCTMTVSKWERGLLEPNAYQYGLMQAFSKALRRDKEVGRKAESALMQEGLGQAMYVLLHTAYRRTR